MQLSNFKLSSIVSVKPARYGQYAFVVARFVIAAFWLNSDIPRWVALFAGHPQANGIVKNLFGPSMVVPLTYFFTLLETLGAIALILGFATKLVSVWGVIEFAITGTNGVLFGIAALTKDFGLFTCALVLLLNGCAVLSIDGLLAKRSK